MIASTNALGHVTRVLAHDAHGNPLEIVDPNGLRTVLAYDLRQRLVSRQVGGERIGLEYDAAGLLTRVSLPDGATITYTYDPAQRLVGLADALGNRIAYTLDPMGNRLSEEVTDPAGNLARLARQVFDPLNRLAQSLGAAGQLSRFEYDAQGNLTREIDPLGHASSMGYDSLNRLVAIADPLGGRTDLRHDGADQLTAVTDPRNLLTRYARDGLGNEASLASPDTGTATRTFDEAGNVRTVVDARGARFTNRYDALDRVVSQSVTGPDGVATTSYAYDAPGALGRLARITERITNITVVTRFSYDLQGRIIGKTQDTASQRLAVGYGYDAVSGQMSAMRLPSGRVLGYRYAADGRMSGITLDGSPIVTAITYLPFGPVQRFTYASGAVYERSFDRDGRISAYRAGDSVRRLTYDEAGRIIAIADSAVPALSSLMTYDPLGRLVAYEGLPARQAFSYDPTGNRTAVQIGGSAYPYAVDPGSNKLVASDGIGGPAAYLHDAMGNITQGARYVASYDARGRLRRVLASGREVLYVVNALGQRIRKLGRDDRAHRDQSLRLR